MDFLSKNVVDTEKMARDVAASLRSDRAAGKFPAALVLALYGDLGSGKTTFTKSFIAHFGVKETVTSPTFVIEKVYELPGTNYGWTHIIHIDAYRIEKSDELVNLGWREMANDPANLIIVEWPERIQDLIPNNAKEIKFEFVDENTRKITL